MSELAVFIGVGRCDIVPRTCRIIAELDNQAELPPENGNQETVVVDSAQSPRELFVSSRREPLASTRKVLHWLTLFLAISKRAHPLNNFLVKEELNSEPAQHPVIQTIVGYRAILQLDKVQPLDLQTKKGEGVDE